MANSRGVGRCEGCFARDATPMNIIQEGDLGDEGHSTVREESWNADQNVQHREPRKVELVWK